jgi:hypothetical protein
MNWSKQGKKVLETLASLKDIDRDDMLEYVGLQERRTAWGTALSTVGIFCIGAIVGAGLGLAFAPKAGAELRNDLGERVRRRAGEIGIGEEHNAGYPNSSRGQVPIT